MRTHAGRSHAWSAGAAICLVLASCATVSNPSTGNAALAAAPDPLLSEPADPVLRSVPAEIILPMPEPLPEAGGTKIAAEPAVLTLESPQPAQPAIDGLRAPLPTALARTITGYGRASMPLSPSIAAQLGLPPGSPLAPATPAASGSSGMSVPVSPAARAAGSAPASTASAPRSATSAGAGPRSASTQAAAATGPAATQAAPRTAAAAAVPDQPMPAQAPRATPTQTPQPAVSVSVDAAVLAKVDEEVTITLPGEGWILLAVMPQWVQPVDTGLEFLRRQIGRESTTFVFRGRAAGDYRASFQRQELATGLLQGRRVLVRVLTEAELAAASAGLGPDLSGLPQAAQSSVARVASPTALTASRAPTTPAAGASGPATVGPALAATATRPAPTGAAAPATGVDVGAAWQLSTGRQAAERLDALGLYDSALEQYKKVVQINDTDLEARARIAELEEGEGNQAAALREWMGLLSSPAVAELAVAGTVRTAAALGDGVRVDANLDALLRITGFGVGKELVAVAWYADRSERPTLELQVLEQYLNRYPHGERADEVYYLMGSLLERAWEGRDLKRALECYRTVLMQYPTSVWVQKCTERVDYLNRHFFYVR